MIIMLSKRHTKQAGSHDLTVLQAIVSLALVQQEQQQKEGEEAAGFRREVAREVCMTAKF